MAGLHFGTWGQNEDKTHAPPPMDDATKAALQRLADRHDEVSEQDAGTPSASCMVKTADLAALAKWFKS